MYFPPKPILSAGDTPGDTLEKIDLYITNIHNYFMEKEGIPDTSHDDYTKFAKDCLASIGIKSNSHKEPKCEPDQTHLLM